MAEIRKMLLIRFIHHPLETTGPVVSICSVQGVLPPALPLTTADFRHPAVFPRCFLGTPEGSSSYGPRSFRRSVEAQSIRGCSESEALYSRYWYWDLGHRFEATIRSPEGRTVEFYYHSLSVFFLQPISFSALLVAERGVVCESLQLYLFYNSFKPASSSLSWSGYQHQRAAGSCTLFWAATQTRHYSHSQATWSRRGSWLVLIP